MQAIHLNGSTWRLRFTTGLLQQRIAQTARQRVVKEQERAHHEHHKLLERLDSEPAAGFGSTMAGYIPGQLPANHSQEKEFAQAYEDVLERYKVVMNCFGRPTSVAMPMKQL
ncbi:UNVERIFIED_CONTAM: hypothetical protein FKN15_077400 [Acipenser sinensis]